MKSEKGYSLLEVLIAVALLGLIVVAVSMGLSMAAKSNFISNEITTAESLARSQIEYVQQLAYEDVTHPSYESSLISDIPDGYSITTPVVIYKDSGIQTINVQVKHGDKIVLALVDYKVQR